jgi:hypothetical protein
MSVRRTTYWLAKRTIVTLLLRPSDLDPLDLIERDLITSAIIETRRSGGFMGGHLLGDLEESRRRDFCTPFRAW